MEEKYKELLKKLYAILKPLGYRKEASDYRLFRPDGLAQIVNIQRNKNNTAQCCMFTINIGVYFEKGDVLSNRKFKEYDCQIRKRVKSEEKNGLIILYLKKKQFIEFWTSQRKHFLIQ